VRCRLLRQQGTVVHVNSIKPLCLELNATRLISLHRANDVSSSGGAG
jgi:hypothetical protein